ncbi:LysR family transcriptional regulator [Pannonibacter tanglangensis]|uniref:LysR family transcriptional regulator n=1 Tax=Pannonibacter tanglangensis TaxID=2750084 RepID=A0ABW9ZD24_9HYPH|nr:LysR substrate-binding domain-containing protein [Pannonibacter sp. XCT-34]NBN62738.1 LysR family transcriptional regulator [Pannonibacter sp. XCT-34]
MDRLAALTAFVRAVDLGSFSAAAAHLGLSQPAVSQQIRALEEQLGTRLLTRTTRRLALTDAGERYLTYARDIVERLEEADRSVQSAEAQMSGTLSVSLPVGFAEAILAEFLIRFKQAWPALILDVHLSDTYVDVVRDRLDVAIRLGEIRDDRLIVKNLGRARRGLFAAPSYLDAVGRPQHPGELAHHAYLLYRKIGTGDTVPLTDANGQTVTVRINPVMIVNNSTALRLAAVAGLGVCLSNSWIVQPYVDAGELEQVLPDWRYHDHPFHAVYPSNRYIPLKVRRFVEALRAFLAEKGAFS